MAFSFVLSFAFYFYSCTTINCLVEAASITPTYKSSCVFLDNKVYCYSGGYVPLGDIRAKRALDEHHYLDLTQNLVLDEISTKWTTIQNNPADYITEPVMAATINTISDTQYLFDGGFTNAPNVTNITRIFDLETNHWSTVDNSQRELFNNSAIYMGTAVKVPNQKRIYFWGGLSGQYPGAQVTASTMLDYSKNFQWGNVSEPLPPGILPRFGHTATLSRDGTYIFYIGGRIRTANATDASNKNITNSISRTVRIVPYYQLVSMNDILIYNTIKGTWSLQQSPSAATVSSRYMHTANLIPGTDKILIYGGATDEGNEKHPTAVPDYLYIFDTQTLEYTKINENQPELGAGPRFGHSAVLCRNNTLIVLFGVNEMGLVTNDVYFLVLSASATWVKSFTLAPTATPSSPVSNDINKNNMLSDKAIIGISIGSVLGVRAVHSKIDNFKQTLLSETLCT
ncbi:hypothetical protein BDF20DRAFT_145003 [Mycotypha africana]|uniref:uncharacterized protein n=1 Tax=Mycotypha africana TaxID=64632 RepID=UPI0023003340|nr:uncharacterized protein BDF20DRAFT_145003 [Mycotypha africana]KAI8969103.1 hypothetical protein BDF20DRAFT_145003 [Mycotypha africana]